MNPFKILIGQYRSLTHVYSPLAEYVSDLHIYGLDVMKEMNTIDTYVSLHIYEYAKCKEITSL